MQSSIEGIDLVNISNAKLKGSSATRVSAKIRADEGPTFETSAHILQTFYSGKISIINASIDKPNSCLSFFPQRSTTDSFETILILPINSTPTLKSYPAIPKRVHSAIMVISILACFNFKLSFYLSTSIFAQCLFCLAFHT